MFDHVVVALVDPRLGSLLGEAPTSLPATHKACERQTLVQEAPREKLEFVLSINGCENEIYCVCRPSKRNT